MATAGESWVPERLPRTIRRLVNKTLRHFKKAEEFFVESV
jgi:hypothetical protein